MPQELKDCLTWVLHKAKVPQQLDGSNTNVGVHEKADMRTIPHPYALPRVALVNARKLERLDASQSGANRLEPRPVVGSEAMEGERDGTIRISHGDHADGVGAGRSC